MAVIALRPEYGNIVRPLSARALPGAALPQEKLSANQTYRRGQKYENWVHTRLEHLYGDQHLQKPWFEYSLTSPGGKIVKRCSPDALLFQLSRDRLFIIECKRNHDLNAQAQLTNLYYPVVCKAFEDAARLGHPKPIPDIFLIEICCFLQHNEGRTFHYIRDLEEARPFPTFNVMVWKDSNSVSVNPSKLAMRKERKMRDAS